MNNLVYEMSDIFQSVNQKELSASISELLGEDVTISSVMSGGKIVGFKISNGPSLMSLECKRRYFKKQKSLRIQLLQQLHEKAVDRYRQELEESFQALCNKYFPEHETANQDVLEGVNTPQPAEVIMKSLNGNPEDKTVKNVSKLKRGQAKIKRRIINFFK